MPRSTGTKKNKTVVDLNRHQIGSIDLSDLIWVEKLSESDRKKYLQDAEMVWANPVFQNEILRMIQAQLEFIGMQALTWEQSLVGRGVINGLDLIKTQMENYHNQHLQAIRPAEKFDKFEIIPQ
jgi:hypothetical protein